MDAVRTSSECFVASVTKATSLTVLVAIVRISMNVRARRRASTGPVSTVRAASGANAPTTISWYLLATGVSVCLFIFSCRAYFGSFLTTTYFGFNSIFLATAKKLKYQLPMSKKKFLTSRPKSPHRTHYLPHF